MNLKNVERNNIVLKQMANSEMLSPMTITGLFMLSVDSVQVDLNVFLLYFQHSFLENKSKIVRKRKFLYFITLGA